MSSGKENVKVQQRKQSAESLAGQESLNPKFRAGILGATGSVGQRFVALLRNHPWIEIVALGASERSVGQKYRDACQWRLSECELPSAIGSLTVHDALKDERYFIDECDIIFSALASSIAKPVEASLSAAGLAVFSNAAAHRYDPHVPILIPHVNCEHLQMVREQEQYKNGGGFIVTNANCSSTGLAVALKPLDDAFGIDKVLVCTLQAVSGAGYPGVSWWDIQANVIPNISGEEYKIEKEPKKILGEYQSGSGTAESSFVPHEMTLSALAHRVPVLDGHLVSVSVKFKKQVDRKRVVPEVEAAIDRFNKTFESRFATLPTMPKVAIKITTKENEPQPRLHVNEGNGMTVTIGRLRPCEVFDVKFVTLSHNTVIGAAGGSIVNAECAIAEGILS